MEPLVYILLSIKDSKTYIGSTNNFKRRFKQHNSGKVKSTKYRFPFKVLFTEKFNTTKEAKIRESWWKSGAGRRRLKQLFQENNW